MRKSELENLIYIALRFKPDYYGIMVGQDGWVKIDEFIYKINFSHGANIIDRIGLYQIAKKNPKFSINAFKTKIKANAIDGVAEPITIKKTLPPDVLYYVSETSFKISPKEIILPKNGAKHIVLLKKVPDNTSGMVLLVDSRQMFAAGYEFFLSHNGDILTERIPGKFVKMVKGV